MRKKLFVWLNLVNLANLKWSAKNPLINVFKEIFNLSEKYFPVFNTNLPPYELVTFYEPLPLIFEYQEELVQKAIKIFAGADRRALLQLPTGAGKTRTALEFFVEYIRKKADLNSSLPKILWLAHSQELLEQCVSSLIKIWNSKGFELLQITRWYGNYPANLSVREPEVIVCTYQKLNSLRNTKSEMFSELSGHQLLIVCDEAHKSYAPTYKKSINELLLGNKESLLLGLTATPGRSAQEFSENIGLAEFYQKNLICIRALIPLKRLEDERCTFGGRTSGSINRPELHKGSS